MRIEDGRDCVFQHYNYRWSNLSESRGVLRLVGGELFKGATALLYRGCVLHVAGHQLDHALAKTCLTHGCMQLAMSYEVRVGLE